MYSDASDSDEYLSSFGLCRVDFVSTVVTVHTPDQLNAVFLSCSFQCGSVCRSYFCIKKLSNVLLPQNVSILEMSSTSRGYYLFS